MPEGKFQNDVLSLNGTVKNETWNLLYDILFPKVRVVPRKMNTAIKRGRMRLVDLIKKCENTAYVGWSGEIDRTHREFKLIAEKGEGVVQW